MKSRGMYETPGGTILLAAHRAIESITLDRGAAHLKDELMPKYAELIYNGFWFAPERELLQTLIDKSQELVAGRVRLKLYKGGVYVDRPRQPVFALRPGPRHLRGRRGRLRPQRRRRLHQAQRAAAAHAGQAEEEGGGEALSWPSSRWFGTRCSRSQNCWPTLARSSADHMRIRSRVGPPT